MLSYFYFCLENTPFTLKYYFSPLKILYEAHIMFQLTIRELILVFFIPYLWNVDLCSVLDAVEDIKS